MSSFKTFILMLGLIILFVICGRAIGGPAGATYAFVLALLMNFAMYWFSDKLVLAMYQARQVTEKEAPKLHKITEVLAMKANMPKPKIYIIPTMHANAFATGRNPQHASVAVTEGILRILSEDELEGVLSHELAHIKNRDILISTIAATVAGAIFYLADLARWMAMFIPLQRDRDSSEGIQNVVSLVALTIVAPIAALLVQMAISRTREYMADATGAGICQKPLSLANALRKLVSAAKRLPLETNAATSHIFIVNPLSAKSLLNLFSTHPPIEERIKRLERLAGTGR